jgi:transcriptional regulator with XRE-family HTH domain
VQASTLADFLRAKRETLDPATVGLPGGGRRRTPGLRREEVAMLAGVSVTWYTWLEQGRDISVSRQVLGGIASALRLDDEERRYLFTLGGAVAPMPTAVRPRLDDMLRRLVDALDPRPAYVVTAWWDLLTYNRAYGVLAGDLDRVPQAEQNILWLMFTSPEMRRLFLDWDDEAARLVGQFRSHLAAFPEDPRGQELLQSLLAHDAGFARLWEANRVAGFSTARKSLQHRTAGRLELDFMKLESPDRNQHLIVFLPGDEQSAAKLPGLLDETLRRGGFTADERRGAR